MRIDITIARVPGALALALGFCLGTAGMAFAMGSSQPDTPTCPRGQVYNSTTKTAVITIRLIIVSRRSSPAP